MKTDYMLHIKLTSTNSQKIPQSFDRNRTFKGNSKHNILKISMFGKEKPTHSVSKSRKYLELNNDENSVISKLIH